MNNNMNNMGKWNVSDMNNMNNMGKWNVSDMNNITPESHVDLSHLMFFLY